MRISAIVFFLTAIIICPLKGQTVYDEATKFINELSWEVECSEYSEMFSKCERKKIIKKGINAATSNEVVLIDLSQFKMDLSYQNEMTDRSDLIENTISQENDFIIYFSPQFGGFLVCELLRTFSPVDDYEQNRLFSESIRMLFKVSDSKLSLEECVFIHYN
ncbi:MAG: hypothetical protein GY751_16225 [Bacteroidetes bacterium]|nr:hypothetical protein [Bacteroidota bacterium]